MSRPGLGSHHCPVRTPDSTFGRRPHALAGPHPTLAWTPRRFIGWGARSSGFLASRNPDQPLPPASLAKLMTAYVIFGELRDGHMSLDEEVTISEQAWRMGGSRMFVEVGNRVTVEDLLRGMIIQSGNDASVALAEHVAGDESTFAQIMNQQAAELGMDNTNFTNATGWPNSEQLTTARDIATLVRAMIRKFPEYYDFYSQKQFSYAGITQRNRNQLLWRDDSVDGLKTGYTEAAGYNLVTSAEREDMRLISVVLGTDSAQARMDQSQALLNFGFRFYGTYELYNPDEPVAEPALWKGATETLPVGVAEPLYVTVLRRAYEDLEASMDIRSTIVAPVEQGEQLGTVKVHNGDTLVAEAPLVALEAGESGGLFGRLWDSVLLRFQ